MRHFAYLKKRASLLCIAALLTLIVWVPSCTHPGQKGSAAAVDFTLTVLHTNDVHSSFGGVTEKGQTCYAVLCEGGRGGYVRLDQAVRAIRQDTPDAVFLDAGDIFQGTLFWTLHKEAMPAALLDKMDYQAIIPGNHEFDDGWSTWLRLANKLKTPVLAANVSFDSKLKQAGQDKINPFIVLEQNGRKIGLVGLVTQSTPETSSPGPGVSFAEAQKTLEEAIEKLTAEKVDIIIALTHLGLENDRRLAKAVSGVDIIVGGHSHSLLSNTETKAEGPYPIVEKTPDGAPALVVTANTASIYLGRLEVGFDDRGIAREWQGAPILLNQATLDSLKVPSPNAALVKMINDFAAPVDKMMKKRIGTIKAEGRDGLPLEDPNVLECRRVECLSGNIVTDSMRTVPFAEAQIAIINGGALRNSLPGGKVTPGDVLATLPFQNTPLMTKMPGAVLWQALERGVANYGEGEGCFLQVSGLRYAFMPSNKSGHRVTSAEVLDKNGQWQPLDAKAVYQVVASDFLARGGDGFSMFTSLEWEEGSKLVNDVLRVYLEKSSPLNAEIQNRITIQP